MNEMQMFINKNHAYIKKAVLWVGLGYRSRQLKELLEHTALEELILTGDLTEQQAGRIMSPFLKQAETKKQRVPKVFRFCSPEQLERPQGTFALLFESLDGSLSVLSAVRLQPDYLIGQVKEKDVSAFSIWEAFRTSCGQMQLVTLRGNEEPQVLSWKRNPKQDVELSVILPMYNVEKYLDQCIETVTAWNADYVEFLFVNDGSPDLSREVVLRWAKKDSRIKLLDKPNGGCASARQWGLDHSKGNYVGFIDPDDFIDESMFRKLLQAAMTGSYEISYCGYYQYFENTKKIRKVEDVLGWPYDRGVTDVRMIQQLIAFCNVAIWRGIYKMDMLRENHIHFYTELRRFDDLPFKVETFAAARSVITVNEPLYYYRLERAQQDVSADDDRLYVHFPIFKHLNESVAGKKDPRITDYLQICKIQTHRYAVEKIKPEFLDEYVKQAREDLAGTGKLSRTFSLAKNLVGRKSAWMYLAIMTGNTSLLKKLAKKS